MSAELHFLSSSSSTLFPPAPTKIRMSKNKKPGRQVKNLPDEMVGAQIYIETRGDRWSGTIVKDKGDMKFRFNDVNYKSPTAACTAHAKRITEKHPEATKGASGWIWILFADGDFKDKSIGDFHDSVVAAAAVPIN